MYVVLDFKALEDLDTEEDLGEEDDLVFFRFCFLGIFGISVGGGQSLNISDTGCCPMDCSKSVTKINIKYMKSSQVRMVESHSHKTSV